MLTFDPDQPETMRYIFLLLVAFGFFKLSAQTGNYFLTHYGPNDHPGNLMCVDIAQDHHGIFYYATRKGVLVFDGKNWELLSNQGAIYSLSFFEGDTPALYWAGDAGYGKIEKDPAGRNILTRLSADDTRDIFESLVLPTGTYFLSSQTLFIQGKEIKRLQASQSTGLFTSMFELFGQVYVVTENRGPLMVTTQDQLVEPSFRFPSHEVIFASRQGNGYLLGFGADSVYKIDESFKFTKLTLEDQQYITASVMIGGTWVNHDLFVLGTLRGGLIFIHPATGKTQEIINYNTGLPDNEIFALMSGKNQSIWAAHEYGFTRVAAQLPFRSFSHYPGLSGNLLCAKTFQDQVYVGTSLGLFYLEKQELFEEISYFVTERVPDKNTAAPAPSQPVDESISPKRGFLRFKKKQRVEKQTAAIDQAGKPQYRQMKKTTRVLRSSQFVYKKVTGIDAKVTQLVQFGDNLIAAGLSGLFQIKGKEAVVFEQEPIRNLYASRHLNGLIASTYSDEIRTYSFQKNAWLKQNPLPNFHDQVTTIIDGEQNQLWLLGPDKAYQLNLSNAQIESLNTFAIHNPQLDENLGLWIKNDLVVVNTSGFFKYDQIKKTFITIDSLPPPSDYVSHGNDLLFHDTHRWQKLGGNTMHKHNLSLINLLPDVRFMAMDETQRSMWLIRGNNLFRFLTDDFNAEAMSAPILCRSIKQGDEIKSFQELALDENNAISFEFTQADYFAAEAIEFRYKLAGLDKTWSAWSRENRHIDFPYLPSGNYELYIESRNVFGVLQQAAPIAFEVLPPYWQRTWFYALEFIVFAVLVLLSYRLSGRYLIVSRVLSLLTIIMLIQFIQTVVSEVFETRASPVMDFFIQVMVAFLILPVEGYMRSRMIGLSSEEAKAKLTQLIQRKGKSPDANTE